MPRGKKELAEQITPELREVEVDVVRDKTILEAVKKIGVTAQTCYRWNQDELLAPEAFDALPESKVLIERCRQHSSTIRPHSALGERPAAPEALQVCAVTTAAFPQPHRAGLLEGKTLT